MACAQHSGALACLGNAKRHRRALDEDVDLVTWNGPSLGCMAHHDLDAAWSRHMGHCFMAVVAVAKHREGVFTRGWPEGQLLGTKQELHLAVGDLVGARDWDRTKP